MASSRGTASRSTGRAGNNAVRDVSPLRDMREDRFHNDVCNVKQEQPLRYEALAGMIHKEINYQHELIERLQERIHHVLQPELASSLEDKSTSAASNASLGEPTLLTQAYASLAQEA